MPQMKGGELIAEFLVAEKIPYVFGICGHGNVGMLDALHARRDDITLVSPRHEQTAAHMADAYFRVRHEPVLQAPLGPDHLLPREELAARGQVTDDRAGGALEALLQVPAALGEEPAQETGVRCYDAGLGHSALVP